MNKMTFQQSEHINIPRKVNSILKYGSSYNGHQSDDSDSDDDEQIRRKFINLNSGRGMIISSNTFTPHLDLNKSAGHQDQGYYENVMFQNENQLSHKSRSLKYRHGGIPVPPIDLDNIQMNNESEYGFNPNRLSGSKADYRLKLRPLSVYSPKPQKIPLKYSNSDADERYSTVSPRRPISHASNDLEYDLEQELATIRSQPSNIKFQGCKGKVNQKEFLEDLASSRKYRKIRRQLSFDSHPTRKWQKTVSLDSGLASSSFKRSKSNDSISEKEGKSQSQTLLDIDEGESMRPGLKRLSFSAEYIIDDITPASTPDEDDNKTLEKTPENLDESKSEEEAQPDEIRIVPKFVEESPPTEGLLLSNSSKSYTVNKSNEKQKRRNIPHILNAFRIPNKKLKKLMKKRPSDSHNSPLKATHDFNEDVTLIETRALDNQESSSENTTPRVKVSMGTDNESFDDSVNTFTKHDELNDSTDFGELKSSCSLPKVDEDKESLEFTISKSPFDHRRSKSSCNITTVNTAESTPQKDEKRQSRRMSDTILSDKPAPHHTHSPSKRFIRKIFSPMVCGVPSPDRRHLFTNNGSLLSLGSYDSASVISDHEQDAYPQLFDFGSHELMEEMTLIDKELLVRIPWGELSILGWMSTDKYIIAPNIMKMVEFFNRVVMMVTTSILSEENVYRRAKIIQKAIKLALKFRYQKNFNSLKAVLGGLQCTPIFRLKQTWKQVPSRYRRVFRELSELMSEENNFYNYRMVLRESMEKPPCIPFLGNFLTTVAHTHAFVSVNYKYKKDSAIESGGESDSNRTSPSPTSSPHEGEDESSNKNSELDKQIDPCLRSSTSKIHSASHMRTDSDDSGVVLNVHRLSRSSDDLETSPREESLSSPDDDGRVRFHEEVFDKKNSQQEDEECFCPSNQETEKAKKPRFSDTDLPSTTTTSSTPNPTRTQLSVCPRHRRSVSEIIMSPTRHHSRSISDAGIRNANDINNVINNRPVAGKENSGLYTCELQFWKYQINAVQYKIIPKSYIRRYLMNCPYNTEEENYKLSLKREPPAPR